MLKSLHIRNYALIQNLNIDFEKGFHIITGETGAGKSILLGALGLILGERAESETLKNKNENCVVEGAFDIAPYNLESFFEIHELEYNSPTLIRRVILPEGKSRAFINDMPVNLKLLKELSTCLIDIHSQHQNLILSDPEFQLKVVDTFANHQDILNNYQAHFRNYQKLNKKFEQIKSETQQIKADQEYYQHQLDKLTEGQLQENELASLEEELQTLSHSEDIKNAFFTAHTLLNGEEENLISGLENAISKLQKIATYHSTAQNHIERLEATLIDLQELAREMENEAENVEYEPERLVFVNDRLSQIYTLLERHGVQSVESLLQIQANLEEKLESMSTADFELENLQKQIQSEAKTLESFADQISQNRQQVFPQVENQILSHLRELGMPHSSFQIHHQTTENFTLSGTDQVGFRFSANKNVPPESISKIASGGEIARVMLTLKSILATSQALPTIIFDEIDTGVSGDIADKMGQLMKNMASNMQVFNITHLPQVASHGHHHYLVHKQETDDTTHTQIKKLDDEARLQEIAKMLSGKNITDSALRQAQELLRT